MRARGPLRPDSQYIRFSKLCEAKIKAPVSFTGMAVLRRKGESVFLRFRQRKKLQQLEITQSERRIYQHQPHIPSILVEDDERVRRFWREFFIERGMQLYLYDSEKSFQNVYQIICFPVQFYFDQDFGQDRGVGLRLAKLIKNSPYRVSTSLVTAYSPDVFSSEIHEGLLDSILPKYPSTLFGANFFKAKMRKETDDKGAVTVVADSAAQLLEAMEPLLNSKLCLESIGSR